MNGIDYSKFHTFTKQISQERFTLFALLSARIGKHLYIKDLRSFLA